MTPLIHPDGSLSGKQPEGDGGAADWKSHPFLEGLSPEHLAILAEYAMPTEFKSGQVVFRAGEIANRFYLVMEGRLMLEADFKGRAPVSVDTVVAGDVLGWSWLFPPYAWNFTARAVEPVRAIFFYGTWLRERCAIEEAFGFELMRRVAFLVIRRLQAARQQLIRFTSEPGRA